MSIRFTSSLLAVLAVSSALAQTPPATEYPSGAVALSNEAIQTRLNGKLFSAKSADGMAWRFDFKDNGYAYLNTDRGYSDFGPWRIESGQWCTDWKKTGPACSELREKDSQLYFKRASNGEVLQLLPR